MPVTDAYVDRKKNEVMQDTWGHLYPNPGFKYYGEMLIAVGEYGDEMIVKSDFPNLECSPQRHEIEHTIFDWMHRSKKTFNPGVYQIKCGLWFFKNCHNVTSPIPIGRMININTKKVVI